MDTEDRKNAETIATGMLVVGPMMLFSMWWTVATLPLALMTEVARGFGGKEKQP